MKKVWKVVLSLVIILMIGGGVAYAMGIDKDYFRYLEMKNYTEDYISPSQSNEGFVSYNAKNGNFTIDIPKDNFIIKELHSSSDDYEDFFAIHTELDGKNVDSTSKDIKVLYRQLKEDSVEYALEDVLSTFSYKNQHEKTTLGDKTVYKGEVYRKIDEKVTPLDPKKEGTNYFFALVVDNETYKTVEISYSLVCNGEDKDKCKIDEEKERETFETIINSISFE